MCIELHDDDDKGGEVNKPRVNKEDRGPVALSKYPPSPPKPQRLQPIQGKHFIHLYIL